MIWFDAASEFLIKVFSIFVIYIKTNKTKIESKMAQIIENIIEKPPSL